MEKVRFGVIGTNTISDKVIFAARQDPRFELAAVCSRTAERAAEFARRHSIPHTFTSEEEMAASGLIDAVYIATPNSCHAAQGIMFMEHGKHVLCEKPMASNTREVRGMIDAAKKNNVLLMEAMRTTFCPNFTRVMDNIGNIGKVRRYFACYCQHSSRYYALKEGTILNAFDPRLSNGAAGDIGVYTIYPMVVLFGRPKSLKAHGFKLYSGADGQGSVIFDYGDMDAVVMYSKIADTELPSEIQGEEGTISIDRINTVENVRMRQRDGEWADISVPILNDLYYYEIKEFIDIVLSDGPRESKVNSYENSMIVMEILDEIRRQVGVVYPADSML